ncbi:MAG: P1 family peptidase [Pseudotabrizicola sp.]|uniref:P1 family peptidase n=1 Tax=Pseudotabrizicola sp. TaxID=2939647 RepID=UPI00273060D3|nr:P1 family peptidase [Pseudotabrizicola sp.]MDP2081905.1 P1 family peptidase [Pseudotabrizicola sp.]MDZ7575977.1 P1 family peptidase [Pseudotabrizicola sp.]
MRPGPRNLITDVDGLRVGQSQDSALRSGVTVLTADRPFTAAVHVMGGAPGTRETDLLAPDRLVQQVDALVLSGGSAFGLDACSGVADALRLMGRGFAVGDQRVPIVPGAILFDLLNGGDKAWSRNPYAALGAAALHAAAADFALGTAGAGYGATTQNWKGGIGSASAVLPSGLTVGALVAVNALGSATAGDSRHFWAAPWEEDDEFGGLGPAPRQPPQDAPLPRKRTGLSTTIAIVATDAALTQAQAQRMAIAAHDGMARALLPSHTPLDGDLVFAAATGARVLTDPLTDSFQLGHAATTCLARAIARAVYLATPQPGDVQPVWRGHGQTP